MGVAGFEGEPVDGVSWIRLGSRPVEDDRRYALAIPSLAQAIRRWNPRVVHGHYVSSYGLLASVARRLAHPVSGPPLVQTAWGSDLLVTAASSRVRRSLASVALREAALITTDSADLEDAAARLALGRPLLRFMFGPPAALLTAPRRAQRIIVSSRRLDPDMRIDLVILAYLEARKTAEDLKSWQLVVAGAGSEEAELRRLARGEPSINFVGQLSPMELHGLLGKASVYVSAPASDATSAALLEAMAAGVVPVVNDLPANREWVDATIGEICDRSPSVSQLAGAIVAATRRERHPAGVRARVESVTWERQVDALVEAYARLGVRSTQDQSISG